MAEIFKFGCLANKICVSDMASKGLTENKCKNTIGYKRRLKVTFSMNVENIARISNCCPENITLVVKCVKLLFPKMLRKRKLIFF